MDVEKGSNIDFNVRTTLGLIGTCGEDTSGSFQNATIRLQVASAPQCVQVNMRPSGDLTWNGALTSHSSECLSS